MTYSQVRSLASSAAASGFTPEVKQEPKMHPPYSEGEAQSRNRRRAVVFAASRGGHLGQAMRLRKETAEDGAVIVTDDNALAYTKTAVFAVPALRSWSNWVRNPLASAALALRLRPRVVVSFGCRDVGFFCLWTRILGARLVLVESFARVRTPSRFARFFAPLASRVFVQWPELQSAFPAASLVSPVYSVKPPAGGEIRNVLIVVGTFREGMDRLLKIVDEASPLPGGPKVKSQIGNSRYIPRSSEWYRWKSAEDFHQDLVETDLVITHDGSNTIGQALESAKPVIVVPRTRNELDYDSNAELAYELERRRWVLVATNASELRASVARVTNLSPTGLFGGASVASCVSEELRTPRTHSQVSSRRDRRAA